MPDAIKFQPAPQQVTAKNRTAAPRDNAMLFI